MKKSLLTAVAERRPSKKAPALPSAVAKRPVQRRVKEEEEEEASAAATVSSPLAPLSEKVVAPRRLAFPPPASAWRPLYDAIVHYRSTNIVAPVDTIGCDRLADATAPREDQRLQTLLALMLSAQTRDQCTAQAMHNMIDHCRGLCSSTSSSSKAVSSAERRRDSKENKSSSGSQPPSAKMEEEDVAANGVAVPAMVHTLHTRVSEETLKGLIQPVCFHNNKAKYIKATCAALIADHHGVVPSSLASLTKLPGLGPKMAHLFLQCADGINSGIGVDVHVHRLAQVFHWVPSSSEEGEEGWGDLKPVRSPEDTRKALEQWLPRSLWPEINALLVGWGQVVCPARRTPQHCACCPVRHLCPSAAVSVTDAERRALTAAAASTTDAINPHWKHVRGSDCGESNADRKNTGSTVQCTSTPTADKTCASRKSANGGDGKVAPKRMRDMEDLAMDSTLYAERRTAQRRKGGVHS